MTLVVAEHQRGAITRASREAISAALRVSPGQVRVVLLGAPPALVEELATVGVAEVFAVSHAALDDYTADGYVAALEQVVSHVAPAVMLLPHSYQTRDFAPCLAARLGAALVTDVVAIEGTAAAPVALRPMFQGKLVARVRPVGQTTVPVIMTLQVGAWADTLSPGEPAPVRRLDVVIDSGTIRQRPEPPFQEARHGVDLGQAERIVAIGRGIKAQEHVALAQRLATALGAELAASRPICDSGWLPMERQVGSSGQTVTPRLYVAVGVSGAVQHLVGMKGSKTIVAVNKDPDAPIFEVADYGIVGDLFDIVPAIVAELEKG